LKYRVTWIIRTWTVKILGLFKVFSWFLKFPFLVMWNSLGWYAKVLPRARNFSPRISWKVNKCCMICKQIGYGTSLSPQDELKKHWLRGASTALIQSSTLRTSSFLSHRLCYLMSAFTNALKRNFKQWNELSFSYFRLGVSSTVYYIDFFLSFELFMKSFVFFETRELCIILLAYLELFRSEKRFASYPVWGPLRTAFFVMCRWPACVNCGQRKVKLKYVKFKISADPKSRIRMNGRFARWWKRSSTLPLNQKVMKNYCLLRTTHGFLLGFCE